MKRQSRQPYPRSFRYFEVAASLPFMVLVIQSHEVAIIGNAVLRSGPNDAKIGALPNGL